MPREKKNQRDRIWLTVDEIDFIDDRSSRLVGNARSEWLLDYRTICTIRVDWGRVSQSAVLRHIDGLLSLQTA